VTQPQSTIALMYHAIGAPYRADPHYAVDMASFTWQLARCVAHGGAVVSALDWLAGKPGIVFTFDDGHASNYHFGFPALREAKASADFFVNPKQVGTDGFATWHQLREMADGGMSIQSHGLDHRYYLTELPPKRLRQELREARIEIEQNIGRPVTLLAPPGGRAPRNLVEVARECGYTHVMTSRPGRIGPSAAAAGELPRLAVTAHLELESLESWLRGGRALLQAQVRYSVLDLAKRLLGDQTYEYVRGRLLGPNTVTNTDTANP
jgi:peptidoglycan/xylan/chitin deacetylase (PgdA/CDA1 family)